LRDLAWYELERQGETEAARRRYARAASDVPAAIVEGDDQLIR